VLSGGASKVRNIELGARRKTTPSRGPTTVVDVKTRIGRASVLAEFVVDGRHLTSSSLRDEFACYRLDLPPDRSTPLSPCTGRYTLTKEAT
jgi:hypothetical protein